MEKGETGQGNTPGSQKGRRGNERGRPLEDTAGRRKGIGYSGQINEGDNRGRERIPIPAADCPQQKSLPSPFPS
jgi:hypothetical protein